MESEIHIREELKIWALENNIRHHALKSLLSLLTKVLPAGTVPLDPRTLLETPESNNFIAIGDGLYWHQGLEFCLRKYFSTNLDHALHISLNINIDGLPIYKSSQTQFWPILFSINEIEFFKPMVIGIYCGKGKPMNLNEYLKQFVNECRNILENGITINGHQLNVSIRCFICDSPARAFIKGVTYLNGKHGCLKCTVVGEYISKCTVFLRTNCNKRTNEGFRNKIYGAHHKLCSPLEQLPIDMIEQFPVGDSLHLIDLGIMKKCLTGWTNGEFKLTDVRFSAADTQIISQKLKQLKMPVEIHRAVRGLESLPHWKGTEYHTFLLYLGIVILKDILRYDAYEHFLSFFCAITICSTDRYIMFLPLAKSLLEHYIERYIEIYKQGSITSNVHNLSHLVDEVYRFGNLNTFNAYPFENQLFVLKRMLRTGTYPLAQAARRIGELSKVYKYKSVEIIVPKLENRNRDGSYNKIILDGFVLSIDMPNKWFLTQDKEIVGLNKIIIENDQIRIKGKTLKASADFFSTPIKSSHLNIYVCTLDENPEECFVLSNITCKLVAIPYNNNSIVFIPLNHTFKLNETQ